MSQRLCSHDGSVLEDKLPPEERLCGQTLAGKYRIEAFLSQGGMGTVYRATHVMLGKPVALKLIRPEIITSPEVVRRFQREARAASLLSHPNIVTIHDLGQHGRRDPLPRDGAPPQPFRQPLAHQAREGVDGAAGESTSESELAASDRIATTQSVGRQQPRGYIKKNSPEIAPNEGTTLLRRCAE